jgi:hypothetical protein
MRQFLNLAGAFALALGHDDGGFRLGMTFELTRTGVLARCEGNTAGVLACCEGCDEDPSRLPEEWRR